ncbi:MAG: redox-sensing transcriptional repressor Rex [Planctomycetia bacterium]|nr:redox-sensing transcriptional repressor Rex [Planctomycetia bacterium]
MNQPVPSIQRLPIYLRFLKGIRNNGDVYVSCTRIAEEFGQLSVQVRKDLGITGIVGRPKIGYQIEELITAIEHFLGWDKKTDAFLVGVGNLGTAVLNYPGFVEHGLNILAAFDNDPKKKDLKFPHCKVYDLDQLEEIGKREKAEIGILAVPAGAAQEIAERLVKIGVRGIWNYTPRKLDLPSKIICEDVKLSASFAVLSRRLINEQ